MGLLNFEWLGERNQVADSVPLLSVENITVRLGQCPVLEDVSLQLFEGEQVRVTGPNGSGKSTLLNTIMGVVPVSSGRILFKGQDFARLATHERANLGIRYMRQRDNVFPGLTVRENLQLALGENGYQRFQTAYPEWAKDIPESMSAGMLSGGQKQKLAWGMTLLCTGHLWLLDESFAGVSADVKYDLLIKPKHFSSLEVTH